MSVRGLRLVRIHSGTSQCQKVTADNTRTLRRWVDVDEVFLGSLARVFGRVRDELPGRVIRTDSEYSFEAFVLMNWCVCV